MSFVCVLTSSGEEESERFVVGDRSCYPHLTLLDVVKEILHL